MGPIEAYIRQSAIQRGINPDVAVAVAKSEGGLKDPTRQSDYVKNGVREQSYGPFQLYMGGGLGNKALAAGIDPRDPNQWQAGVDFALDAAKSGGWSPWYGAKKIGVTGFEGIGGKPTSIGAQPGEATVAEYRAGQAVDKPVFVGDAPVTPVQDTPAAAAPDMYASMQASTPAQDEKKGWRKALSKAIAGYKMPEMAKADTGIGQMAMPKASRVDTPDIAPFDPNAIAQQRQNLAMAMQRLNTGRLWI